MNGELERQLRERLQRADLPGASQDLRISLESVVRTPVDPRNRRDRRGPLRLLAIAAVIAGGGTRRSRHGRRDPEHRAHPRPWPDTAGIRATVGASRSPEVEPCRTRRGGGPA